MSTALLASLAVSALAICTAIWLWLRPRSGHDLMDAQARELQERASEGVKSLPRMPKDCKSWHCKQGRRPCPTPVDCGVAVRPSARVIPIHAGVPRSQLDAIRLHASAASDESANPHPPGSKHAVAWASFFHEAQLTRQWARARFSTRSTAAQHERQS